MDIVVAGVGYVGLVTAVCLAEIGHNVTCIDVQREKIKKLLKGESPIFEPNLENLMHKNKERLHYVVDGEGIYKKADVIFITVGTPENEDGSVNLKYLYNVVERIAEQIEKDVVIVIKSTVPIGTNDQIEKFIRSKLKNNINIEVVSNPEFLSQGTAIEDTLNAQRIVLGVSSEKAKKIMKQVYDKFEQPYIFTDRHSAEMIKYASNDFLALKISYINEIANLCEKVDANVEDVAIGMGMDSRIGDKFLKAGIGYGGSCFPKDTKALQYIAKEHGCDLKTINATIEVNDRQKKKLIEKAKKYYRSFKGIKIAVLGLTFKPNTDDLRESPALDNIPVLIKQNAIIKVYDPAGENNFKKIYPSELIYCDSIEETLEETELCLIFTDWKSIKQIDMNLFIKLMKKPIIIDGRNCFDINKLPKGMIYESIGRKIILGGDNSGK